MKKRIVIVLFLVIGLAAVPRYSYAGNINEGDTIVNKASDWFATIGKSPEDRDVIIQQRRMDRAAKRLGEAMKSGSKKAGKEMEKMGKDMGKLFDDK